MNQRKRSQAFSFFLLTVLMALFIADMGALVMSDLKPEVVTLLGGWGGVILGMIGMIVSFEFGSSKGSQMKDEAAQRNKGGENEEVTTVARTVSDTVSVRDDKPA